MAVREVELSLDPLPALAAHLVGEGIEPLQREAVEEPGTFFFYENWESGEHLDAHLQTPHLVEFAGRLEELLDEQGLTINRLRRIA